MMFVSLKGKSLFITESLVPICESLLSLFSSGALLLLYVHSGHGREAGVIGSSLGDTGAWDLLWVGTPGQQSLL